MHSGQAGIMLHTIAYLLNNNRYKCAKNRFRCPHCPFVGCNNYSLGCHIRYHTVRFSLQCSFCTFSVSSKTAIMRHVNRVHPEQKAVKYSVKKNLPKKRKQSSINTIINSTLSPVIAYIKPIMDTTIFIII